MLRTALILPLAAAMFVAVPQKSHAILPFFKAFVGEYVEDTSDEDWTKLVKKEAKCFVCHQGKKSKKNRNAYGKELGKLLTKKDAKDTDKIIEALKKVSEMHTDADDDKSPTYGELIAEGKLPAGDLEDLKEEPKEE